MPAESLVFPSPPRRVLPASQGALMAELETGVVVARKESTLLRRVCTPEEKGERLLWPVGLDRCVMLASKGILKVYENGVAIQRHPRIFDEDDELVETRDGGRGQTTVLLGRMMGDPLGLSTPEYRFLVLKNTVQVLARPAFRMQRRPLGWGPHPGGSHIFVLLPDAEREKLLVVPLDDQPAQGLAGPLAVAGKRPTGMSVEPATGHLALTLAGNKAYEAGVLKPGGTSPPYTVLAAGTDVLDQPAWSPSGHALSYRCAAKGGRDLMMVAVSARVPRKITPLREGDETLWLDGTTLAVVSWDKVARLSTR